MAGESHDPGIDPRYAPQFQRGFDPDQHAAEPARRGPVRLAGGPPPTAVRVPDPPRLTTTARAETPEVAAPSVVESNDVGADDVGVEPPLRGTRWDWLLPGIGGLFVLVAFGMWWDLGTDTGAYFGTSPNDQWHVFWQQLRWALPGPLLTAGAVAITAGVVLQAIRPRP